MARKSMKINCGRMLVVSLLLIALAIAGICGTLALLIDTTDPIENEFLPVEIDGEITEKFDGKEKTDIAVKNTGTAPAYMRVRLVSYWVDSNGQIVAKDSWLQESGLRPDNGWFVGSDGWYYYPLSVAVGDSTKVLFEDAIPLKEESSDGTKQVLEILAEAIQVTPADAVEAAWSAVDVDENGKLIAATTNAG